MKPPEAQRIAIAEACGWKNCVGGSGLVTRYKGTPSETTVRVTLPNYLTDLNAMHEAEKVLTPLQWFSYSALLTKIVGAKDQEYYLNLHATAAQRAEAFLRTLNLFQ